MSHHLSGALRLWAKIDKCVWSDPFCGLNTEIIAAIGAIPAGRTPRHWCLRPVALFRKISLWKRRFQFHCPSPRDKPNARDRISKGTTCVV